MSLSNFIPDDGSLWSIRAVDISGNYNQKLSLDASGNAIIITGNTNRLTINSSGAWTCQGGMTYNNSTNTLTPGTFSGTATTATNIAGGIASQIPYQSAPSTTAFIPNGTAGQVLTSNGTSVPTWQTSPQSIGLIAFDDFMYNTLNGSPMGIRQAGVLTGAFAQIGSSIGHTGVMRGLSAATFQGVLNAYAFISTFSSATSPNIIMFDNVKIGGAGLTYIFKPFAAGDALQATAIIGLSNDFTNAANPDPTAGVYWRYTTATNYWGLFADNGAVITSVAGSQANVWCKISIIRTGTLSFSSTFTIIGGASTTGTGSVASATATTYNGWIWGNNGVGGVLASKYMDIDYCSGEWNSDR